MVSAKSGLIMDIGMHRGEDAEFYLRKGFRVVAVEADPRLVQETTARLLPYIESGDLEICNVAIADYCGQIDFYSSERDGWGSVSGDAARCNESLAIDSHKITVRCATLSSIFSRYGSPYFLKVDIEGSDLLCLKALECLPSKPRFVSLECNLANRAAAFAGLASLWALGYRGFKLLNQALNPLLHCPFPAKEGRYVNTRFTPLMSGPFGDETPGEWASADRAWDRLAAIMKTQQLRTAYAATGKLWGIPIGRFHRQLHWFYNAPPTRAFRRAYSRLRGIEVGGWFDLHARFGD